MIHLIYNIPDILCSPPSAGTGILAIVQTSPWLPNALQVGTASWYGTWCTNVTIM